jgi:serine/threonine-protein kinase GIN4
MKVVVAAPNPPLRLSAVVDASLFIASPASSKKTSSMEVNDLEASPYRVEPYPARAITGARSLDSPNTRRRVESRYEQMVTTAGVKKVGVGYESEDRCAIGHIASPDLLANTTSKKNLTFFHSTRRAMPPPVSSEDWRKTVSVDELGMTPAKAEQGSKEDRNGTSSVVRRAFNIMTGKTHSRRQSRIG